MPLPRLKSDRFDAEHGFRVIVQTPEADAQRITDAVLRCDALAYGDYDRVTFCAAVGEQRFRSLGGGRNKATADVVAVPCVELSFFIPAAEGLAVAVLTAIYAAHPYEEPVIYVQHVSRTRHIRGLDEDNPNRFWNAPDAEWLPAEHRSDSAAR